MFIEKMKKYAQLKIYLEEVEIKIKKYEIVILTMNVCGGGDTVLKKWEYFTKISYRLGKMYYIKNKIEKQLYN